MRLRDANPADLPVIADLIRALAEYERLTHEIEWTEDELAATLFGPDAVPRVVLAEPTDPPGPAVGLAVWFPTYSTFLGRAGIWLEDLFVRPEARGAGVGTALLQHLFDRPAADASNGRCSTGTSRRSPSTAARAPGPSPAGPATGGRRRLGASPASPQHRREAD